ncbi:MAG: SIR2 family protein [Chloroflexi bacterium]|nr:SIR2 family protein [Chloroflexota bacterium]MCL5273351.1 SIR2 family protein [Chloroflexota bacterium]
MPNRRELAFLLGAGAVVDVGLPTAIGLQKYVEEGIAAQYSALLPALWYIEGAIQFGKSCRGEKPSSQVNIEELVIACATLAARNRSHIYPFVSAWHERVSQLQQLPNDLASPESQDAFKFLTSYCKSGLREWLAIKEAHRLKYLRNFKDFIDAGYKLHIFTLNYDECIECALRDALGPINERWTTGFDNNGWHPSLLLDDQFDACVYKLHGSLDWINDPRLGICSVKWPPAKDTEELAPDFDSLLIFGTDAKLQSIDPYLTLLYHFQQMLHRCGILASVGYSFGDNHINEMLLQALQRDPQMRCVIAHKGKEPKDLLPVDFDRMVSVENRFVHVKAFAKDAFEQDELLQKVKDVFKTHQEEAPF